MHWRGKPVYNVALKKQNVLFYVSIKVDNSVGGHKDAKFSFGGLVLCTPFNYVPVLLC